MSEHANISQKLEALDQILRESKPLLVAFSGGVDSTFLLARARFVLNDQVVAVTAASETFPDQEVAFAKDLANSLSVRHIVTQIEELTNENFRNNGTDRCYHCKNGLFTHMSQIALREGFETIADGSNLDDLKDYRPGMTALKELHIRSPLVEAKLTKDEIRSLSKEMGLPTWNKPSFACLSSRIPYGTEITQEIINQIEKSERFLYSLSFKQIRVRYHGTIARIEVMPEDFPIVLEHADAIDYHLKSLGFQYITMDLKGYRTGSMNQVLNQGNNSSLGGSILT